MRRPNTAPALAQLMQRGVAAHRAGRPNEAEDAYRQVLAADPNHAHANYLLGVIAATRGDYAAAETLLRHALKADSDLADAHHALGNVLRHLGRNDAAKRAYERALRLQPRRAEFHAALASLLSDQGHLAGAESAIRKALDLAPTNADLHYRLGNVLRRRGRPEDALAAYRAALGFNPVHRPAQINLGATLHAAGHHDEAIEVFRTAADTDPQAFEMPYDLANVLLAAGRRAEAETAYRSALRLAPKPVPTAILTNLAVTLDALGRHEDCVVLLRQALADQPDMPEIYLSLCRSLMLQGRIDEALDAARAGLERRPDSALLHLALGNACLALQNADGAIAAYRDALEREPDFVDAHANLAAALNAAGRDREADAAYRKALHLAPRNARVLYGAALQPSSASDPGLLRRIEAAFAATPFTGQDGRLLGFALGHLLDRAGRYDEAFAAFDRANAVQRRAAPYDQARDTALFAAIEAAFTPAADSTGPDNVQAGAKSPIPIFIVGMPRSGTSLVEQMLAMHPAIQGGGELPFLAGLLPAAPMGAARTWPAIMAAPAPERDAIATTYVRRLAKHASGRRFVTDKLPHNFQRIGFIARHLPQARIVHVVRDPMDTCLSIFTTDFQGVHPYAHDLADIAHHYRLYERLMQFWHRTFRGRIHDVSLADLITDPRAEISTVLASCGLQFDEACLAFHQSDRIVTTSSVNQVRQPLNPATLGRWRHYERHLGPLRAAFAQA